MKKAQMVSILCNALGYSRAFFVLTDMIECYNMNFLIFHYKKLLITLENENMKQGFYDDGKSRLVSLYFITSENFMFSEDLIFIEHYKPPLVVTVIGYTVEIISTI